MASGQAGAPIQSDGGAPTLTCLHEAPLVVGALDSRHAGGFQSVQSAQQGHLITQPVAHALRGEGFDASEDGTGRGTPLVPVAQPIGTFTKTHKPMSSTDAEGWSPVDAAPTVTHWPRDRSDTGTDVAVVQATTMPLTFSTPAIGDIRQDDVASTMSANTGGGGETQNPAFITQPVAFYDYLGSQGGGVEVGISPPLKKKDGVAISLDQPSPLAFKVRGGCEREDGSRGSTNIGKAAGKGYLGSEHTAFTVASSQDQWVAQPVLSNDPAHAICANEQRTYTNEGSVFQLRNVVGQPMAVGFSGRDNGQDAELEVSPTLRTCANPTHDRSSGWSAAAAVAMQVRRLTPLECARLQGFPDDYLLQVPWRGKTPPPDGPMYKALGNSMAVNCMDWIGQRIQMVEEVLKTVKSRPEFTADRTTD